MKRWGMKPKALIRKNKIKNIKKSLANAIFLFDLNRRKL